MSAVIPGPTSGLYAFSNHVRGRILLATRNGDAAVAQLDVALDKLGNSGARSAQSLSVARSERALALAYSGRVDAALADLRAFEAPTPHLFGIVQRLSGDFTNALESQRKEQGGITPGPASTLARSQILTEIGLNQLALGDVESATIR